MNNSNITTKLNGKRIATIFLIAVAFVSCLAFFVSCNKATSSLSSISATYGGGEIEVGGKLNREDITVVANYSNTTQKVVTSYELSYDFSSAGPSLVTVTYSEGGISKSFTFNVNVVERLVVTLESITAVYNGADIPIGGTHNHFDFVITAHYSDGSSKKVTTNYTVGSYSTAMEGTVSVPVSYTEDGVTKTCTVTITVVGPEPPEPVITLESITVVYNGENIKVGGTLNNDDFIVTAHYSDQTTKKITNFNASELDSTTAGEKVITITYTENDVTKACQVVVIVEEDEQPNPPIPVVTLESITAVYNGEYVKVGGTLNNDDIVVTANYSDESSKEVTNFAVAGFSSATAGVCTVTVSYSEDGVTKETTINITIVDDSNPVIFDSNLSVHFLELGNQYSGDCVYIKAGETDILIDAGSRKNSASTLINYINKYVTDGKLEYVIVTHEHQDHISGFMGLSGQKGIFEQYQCENIIDFPKYKSNLTTASGADSLLGEYIKARDAEVAAGANHYTALDCVNNANGAQKVYDLTGDGSITMEILYQKHYEVYSADENNYSVCVMINQKVDSANTNHYLFTGDLEESGEKSLVESNPNLPEMVLFKGGHHGSYTATNDILLQKIKPQYVCICCCAGNVEYLTGATQDLSRSFPAQEMINRIAKYTDNVYVTTLGKIKRNDTDTKWVNDGFESMNGNIVLSCVNGDITLNCSNNNLKLKDTEWFKKNRDCPEQWKSADTSN